MKAADKYAGQLSAFRSISTFPLQRTALPKLICPLATSRVSPENNMDTKGGKRGETRFFFFLLCFLGYLLQGSSSSFCFRLSLDNQVVRLAPRDSSSFWVLITPLSCTVLAALGVLTASFFVSFWVVSPGHVWILLSAVTV